MSRQCDCGMTLGHGQSECSRCKAEKVERRARSIEAICRTTKDDVNAVAKKTAEMHSICLPLKAHVAQLDARLTEQERLIACIAVIAATIDALTSSLTAALDRITDLETCFDKGVMDGTETMENLNEPRPESGSKAGTAEATSEGRVEAGAARPDGEPA